MQPPHLETHDTRTAILFSALLQFSEHGFACASTRKIAQAAGANIGSIAYHFGDKAGLYRAVFRELPQHFAMSPLTLDNESQWKSWGLAQILEVYYLEFTESNFGQEYEKAAVKLWFREMVEPTGEGMHYLKNHVIPKHQILERAIAKEIGAANIDEGVQVLTQFVAALGSHLMSCEEVWRMHTPHCLDGHENRAKLRQRMVEAALAMVGAERQKRMGQTSPRNKSERMT